MDWIMRMVPLVLIVLCCIELCGKKVSHPKLWVAVLLFTQINVFVAAIRNIMEWG